MAKLKANERGNPGGIFLKDGADETRYSDLLRFVSQSEKCPRRIAASPLRDCLFSIALAMAENLDVELVDSFGRKAEMGGAQGDGFYGLSEKKKHFTSLKNMLEAISDSKSEISLFTSGTSGSPKKITHAAKFLLNSARVSDTHAGDVWGFAYNPVHIAGLQVFFQALLNSNPIVNLFGLEKSEIFSEIEANSITHISATPTFFRLLLPETRVYKSVLRLTCGGEKSDARLHEDLRGVFPNAKISNIYASTEFGALLVSDSCFFRIPERLSECIKVENGELLVHKKLLGECGSQKSGGDFYRSGDIVEFDPSDASRFRFVARAGNVLNVGGYRVNLEEIEEVLRSMPGIADAVAYARKNSLVGNLVCALVKPAAGNQPTAADIRKFLSKKLQNYKIPRKIDFVDNIQLTETGKIKR